MRLVLFLAENGEFGCAASQSVYFGRFGFDLHAAQIRSMARYQATSQARPSGFATGPFAISRHRHHRLRLEPNS